MCSQNHFIGVILMKTHNLPFSNKRQKIILNLQPGDFSKVLKNEFKIAWVNESSVFEPLKFYCRQYINGFHI